MNMMIFGAGTPSACERSRTLTPDSTVTGPVGRDDLTRRLRPCSLAVRAAAGARRAARFAALSMTTRRLRRWPAPPCRGRMGLFGLFEPGSFAI